MCSQIRQNSVWKTEHEFQAEYLREYEFLYHDWIYPCKYTDCKDKEVLDAGSGPGIQVRLIAKHAKRVTAVDLDALDITCSKTKDLAYKVDYVRADIGTMDLGKQFDIVNCVGTIHHTDNPDETFRNLYNHVKPGGKIIIWTYSHEGNFLVRRCVEPLRKLFLDGASHRTLWGISFFLNAVLYPIIHTIYRLPLTALPYYEYFENARKMSFKRNALNIYDKLNAPQTHFVTERQIRSWFNSSHFRDVHISMYKGVSWRGSGTKI